MAFSSEQLIALYTNLLRARRFDRLFAGLISQGKLLGFYHQAEGGEAPGVGACSFLRQDDFVCPHLRGHGLPHMIAKGVDARYFLAEHTGKASGLCRGMSTYHSCAPEFGLYGSAGTIGSNFPVSVGYGLAAKMNGREQVVVSCFGDGGSNRGTLHEAFLMAANWKLPVVWVCENNGLAMYVPVEQHHPMENIASLAPGYGMPYEIVDGMDVVAVAEVVGRFVERARAGMGPAFVECLTTRYHEHDIGMPDLVGSVPRTSEEIEKLRQRDPVTLCRQRLLGEGVLTDLLVGEIDRQVAAELEAAEQYATDSPLPDPAHFEEYLYVNPVGGRS
jgi:TPP-dependent pyruvate/acetoin dehydrogenase alpha subunit